MCRHRSRCDDFFFSSRRRHTRCALVTGVQTCALPISHRRKVEGRWEYFAVRRHASAPPPKARVEAIDGVKGQMLSILRRAANLGQVCPTNTELARQDRKSVVSGKSVYVRLDLGGRRLVKKQIQS